MRGEEVGGRERGGGGKREEGGGKREEVGGRERREGREMRGGKRKGETVYLWIGIREGGGGRFY